MTFVDLLPILGAALIASASPGPATLAIAGTSMGSGRAHGLALAIGVTTGSWMWSVGAALGLGALMLANAWAFELIRYVGAGYLLYLAVKSAKSAITGKRLVARELQSRSLRRAYLKGLGLHLTNPKAVLFFGALYAIGIPPGAPLSDLLMVMISVGLTSLTIFTGYALLFSLPNMMEGYAKLSRWFDGVFAVLFGAAGLKILTAKLT